MLLTPEAVPAIAGVTEPTTEFCPAGMPYSQLVIPFIVAGVGVSMAIPAGQNSVVGSVDEPGAIGKAPGTNSMMRELGGVFGIALAAAVFAAAGGYASAQAFTDGFGPAIGAAAGLALVGAAPAIGLPSSRSRRDRGAEVAAAPSAA